MEVTFSFTPVANGPCSAKVQQQQNAVNVRDPQATTFTAPANTTVFTATCTYDASPAVTEM
jgi:hypothetical protein